MDFMGSVNLFHGRIESGKAVFGALELDHPGAAEGQAARLFVRPYNLEIHARQQGGPAFKARVERVQAAGPHVRVELVAETGEAVTVEVPHTQFGSNRVSPGQDVYLSPRDTRIFMEDYTI
jgi:sulfate transport system ATP-binding protein